MATPDDLKPIPVESTSYKYNWGKGVEFPFAPNNFQTKCMFCGAKIGAMHGLAFRTGDTNHATGGAVFKNGCPICLAQEMKAFWQKYPKGKTPGGGSYKVSHVILSLVKEYLHGLDLIDSFASVPDLELKAVWKDKITTAAQEAYASLWGLDFEKLDKYGDGAVSIFKGLTASLAAEGVVNYHHSPPTEPNIQQISKSSTKKVGWTHLSGSGVAVKMLDSDPTWSAISDVSHVNLSLEPEKVALSLHVDSSDAVYSLKELSDQLTSMANQGSMTSEQAKSAGWSIPPLDAKKGGWVFPPPGLEDAANTVVKALDAMGMPESLASDSIKDKLTKMVAEHQEEMVLKALKDEKEKKLVSYLGPDHQPTQGYGQEPPKKPKSQTAVFDQMYGEPLSWEYAPSKPKIKAPQQQGVVPKSKQHKVASYPKVNFKGKKGSW